MGYICDGSYRNEVNQSFKHIVRDDGLVASVNGLLYYNYNDGNWTLLNMLLRSF